MAYNYLRRIGQVMASEQNESEGDDCLKILQLKDKQCKTL